jgi:type I restriction enzyme S subunit
MRKRKLGELCEAILSGGTPSTKEPCFWNGDIPWITSADIQDDFTAVPRKFVSQTANPNVLPANSVLVVTRVGLGKVATSTKPIAFSQDIQGLILKDGVHHRYLVYALSEKVKRFKDISRGATIKGVTRADLEEIELPLPSFSVQKEIAHILSQADKARQQRKAANGLTEQFLQSAFLSLFGDPVRNDKGWEVKRLADLITSFKYGTNQKASEFEKAGAPVLRIPNVIGNQIDYSNLKYAELPAKEYQDLKLQAGDLLFVRTNGNPNYIGRCAVFKDAIDCVYASYLIRGRLKEKNLALSQFLQTVLSYETYRPIILKSAKTTAGNYNINTEALRSFIVPVPPQSLLEQFASIAARTETLRRRQQAHRDELEGMFQGLLQRYFS